MADKVTSLYNALKADGLFKQARSLNDFKAKMAYQGYRSQIYKLARDKGANVGTFSQFTNALGYSSGSPKSRQSYGSYQPQQQKQEENTAMTTAQRAMQVPRQYQRTQLSKAPKNASPFVQSLYEMDDAQKVQDHSVDYTSPKATQQVYQRNQRVRRQAAKTAARKMDRQASHAQPIMQTNTPADTYIGKTEGQLMDEMNQSANALVGSEMGDYLDKVIGDEFKAAHARGLATLSANSGVHGTGGADWWIGERAYQNQMDQDKQLQEITGNIQKNIESIFSDPKVKQRVLSDARRLGVSPEAYIESSLAPALIEKAGEQFNKTQLNRMMAKGASDYIASGILNSLTGTLLTGLVSTKSQRQMQQQADAMTEEGLNPNYKPGTCAKAAKGAVAFAADAPWYNLAGYGAGALTEKVFGNTAQQMARMANQSLRQRVFRGVTRGVVHGGATGLQYGAINGAVQNYSTGEDTSLWGTLKAAAKGGLEEGVSFATMEGMGGAVGAFGHGIGLKGTEKTWKQRVNKMGQKLTYEGIKTGMEGIGMATGGVASSYANHVLTGDDWHGFSTEGTLESCASAVIFKLTHAKDLFKKETDRNGKPFSFTSNIAQKAARFFLSGEAKSAPHVFSDEEKHQLFSAGSELGMKPMENIISWAKQAKKYRAEDIEKSEDGSDLLNNYQQIMQDPNVSWDAKAKFTTMVMGTMPESRPMMDHISYGTEEGTDGDNRIHTYKTINEYASDGTLLSKHRFDTKDKRESIVYEIGVRKEELRSKNALALLVGLDRNNYDLQNAFFKENAKDWEQVQGIVEGMQTGGSKIDHQFTEYVLNSERGSFLPIVDAVANKNGMDREGMLKAFDKDPMKRTDAEQNACVQLRKAIEMEVFPANKVHEEQSNLDGKDVATDNNLGTEQPNGEAVKAELNGLKQAEDEMDVLMRDNDVFGQNFQRLKQQGLTNPQIYDWMVQQGGLTVEQLEPFAHYINANARVQGMQEATKNAIDQHVSSYVQDWTFHGTLNGQEAKGEQAIFVQDRDGRTLLLGSGEIAFDSTTGRAKEGVGDMIVCLDPTTNEMVYLKTDDVTLSQTQDAENFANEYRQKLQMINSKPYNEAAQKQAMQDETSNGERGAKNGSSSTDAASANVTTSKNPISGEQSGSASNPNDVSGGKGTENNPPVQANPIGKGVFGDIYDGFRGKVKEAFRFLTTHKGGDLLGVFSRKDVGDIDLVWGDRAKNQGLDHIIDKHIERYHDFANVDEAMNVIDDIINNGTINEKKSRWDKVVLEKDGYMVIISKNIRDAKGNIVDSNKNWIVTAFDSEHKPKDKSSSTTTLVTPDNVEGGRAVTPNEDLSSTGKDTNNSSNGNGSETTLTFENGEKVPVDANGEPDFLKMTPEQGAEVYKMLFEEDAQAQIDADIKSLENDLKKVQKSKYNGKTVMERAAARKQVKEAIAVAEAQVNQAKAIKAALEKPTETVSGGEVDAKGRYEQERQQGYRVGEGGVRYDRQKADEVDGIRGKEVEVAFSPTEKVKGHVKLVELDTVQASHNNGQLNPLHFGPDWQPKDRGSEASKVEATKIAGNIDPSQITGNSNAFIGSAPSVNERHETIQGNNRVEALKQMYSEHPEQAAKYKQWLMDHAAEFGLNTEDIAKMKKPVIVNELPVDDSKAKELGQMMASGFESGGKRIPEISATINKLGDKMERLASVLLSEDELGEDAKLSDLINQNSLRALEYLNKNGFIDNTEYENLAKDPTTRRQWLENILKASLFDGDRTTEKAFNSLPGNAQKAVLATFMRDMKSKEEDRIKPNIQKSFEAYNELNQIDTFKNAKNIEQARAAIQAELLKGSNNLFGDKAIRDKYTNFELELAALYKGLKAQKELTGLFGKFFDAVQGMRGKQLNAFEQANTEPLSKDEAIEKVFGTNNELSNDRRREIESPSPSGERDGVEPTKRESERGESESSRGVKIEENPAKPKQPSADPMQGIKEAADSYHEDKKKKSEFLQNLELGKARQEYAEAKEHGDASEIKRTRDELKQLLDEHYKAQHMGLVQRRKEIAKEIGMTEAKKIDKPFNEMDSEEREYVANQNPLTESEIREQTSEENKNFIEDAVDYINGNHGFAQKMAYLKIYDDVRNRHENVSDNSGAENGTQLDAANTTGGEKLGLGRGRESGGSDGPVDRGTGNEAAPGEPEGREGNQNDTTLSVGKPGDKQGEGNSSDMGAVPSGNTDTKGSGSTGKDGNVSEQRGRESSNRPAKPDAKRKPAAKQGTTWRGRTGEEIKKNVADKKSAALAAIAELKKRKFGKGGSGHLGSFELLTPDQMEYVPTVMNAVKEYGMAIIDEGIYKVKDWFNHIRETFAGGLKDCGFTDQDIDDFIKEMWNSKMTMDGETHTIAEWCSIYGNQKLREKLGEELDIKYQKQMDAEPIEVKIGDRKNIEETLPFLLPQQQDDVLKAETQFFGKDHTDREHAYGKGYMFTNGTGTGKTYTGLGIAKRLAKQGKGRILFITPSQKKVNDWMKDGKNLGLDIRDLDSVAKEKGTTATTESGDGMVITTFANFGLNKKLLETEWDAVIYDECHRIMENKKGAETARSMQHYMMTNRDENHCFLRLQTINPHYQKMQNAADRFNELRQKEVQRIQKEYKQSHPSATAKDVVNATFSQLPKELNSFALADATAFPKLGKAYQDFTSAKQHYYNNVEPKLKEQAKNTWKNTKTIFLSATPFNTRENLDYAEGYIFKFPEDDGSRMSGRSRFYLDHFGAAYRYRYNRLEAKTDNPAAVAKQEVAFSDYLQDTLGTMSGRIIDSAYDYSRDFPTVAPDHADEFNNAVEEAVKGRYLGEAYSRTIGDYNYGSALFETMKVANIIQRMKDHLAAGRKIVVFHRRVETKNPIQPPFAYMLEYANRMIAEMKPGKERNEAIKECTEFRNKYADLLDWEQTLDYSMPREQIAKVFGRDNVLFFSGKESKKVKDKAVDTFNDDNSGKNIIVIQEASGKEGISLHDVTGNHQRVLITLGLPQSPITALQIEGRTYRIGNKSNAIFEYPILGLNSEMMLFGQKFNNQVSTTENLALGSQARNLRDSFANGILEHSGIVPIDQQGVGGKEFDAPKQSDSDPFDDAVLDYYSNQKLNRNNREGVDYFPTPEPLGYKMVEWANMGEGDTALEPSAGHGAIARYVSKSNELLSIEPSQSLFAKLQLKAGGLGRKFLNSTFENYNVANKHDVVVMNPPFGTAGATAIAHLDKAFRHLDEGGRVVAIIPRGSTDKKFDKWYGEQKNVAMRAEVDLPDIVFQQAGTNVRCRVVVLDKITDNALRSKAGYPEKIDLSGHYDKIEDFFEDLRDVQMPDRIIDTQMKSMKKARTFKKDIEDIKGMTVTIEKNGISVFDKNAYRDYSISFPSIKHNEEWTKENYSKVYERFDQEQNSVYSENSKAELDEMKKLACKLAGMSEEEMQRYIASKNNGGTHFRESRGLQYSKSDTKDVKNSRIIPEDVDKNVSSQIEKTFDSAIEEIVENAEDRDKSRLVDDADHAVVEFSNLGRRVIEYYRDDYERKVEKLSGQSIGGHLGGKNDGKGNRGSYLLQYYKTILAVADRELAYRDVRAKNLRETWGLQSGGTFTLGDVERIFKETNRDKAKAELFQKALDISKRLGVNIKVSAESPNKASGEADIYRNIDLYIDGLVKTKAPDDSAPTIMLHEMIHEATMGAINLVKKGKAEGVLTPKQIEGVKTILEIYDRVKDDKERFKEEPYGLTDAYELTAQMADSRQRKAMDLSIWDRVVNAAHEFARKGDRSILQRVKDAVKKLFEVSDKSKMDKALNDIMDDFNETIDDMSMNDIEQDNFGYRVTDKDELDRLDKEKTFRMYSGMQELDGKLYSPMAAIIDGKRTDATEIGAWMGADERPDLVKKGKFTLVKTDKNKGVGEGDVPAAYNPYMHTSTSMMNDQFTGAYARGNIKVVEWEIPESEKTSGYHAEGAKDAVGLVPWHSGSVNSLLPKDRQRQVMLSRWRKAVRVVPDSEVAESIAEQLKGTGLAIPWNVVTPNQVRELAKLGVPITTVESGRQAPETKEKFLRQMADLEKEFHQAKFVNVKMTKDAFKVWGKDSGAKFRTDHGDDNYPASSVESHVEKVAQKTGGKVKMISSVDEITNKAAKAAVEEGRKITGWYDEKTGEVHLYMPNIHDRYTAEKTIWHETVGHKGMRGLIGESFDKFLRDVWYDLDKPENAALKKLVDEERKFNPMNIYDAIEEGIARLAEDGKGEAGFWNGIKNKVSDFLHEIGYRIAPNTKDVKYLLWLSKNLQKNPNDPYWKMRAEAVRYRLSHEDVRSVVSHDGMFYENDGKSRSLADLPKAEYQEATDGEIHFRTTPTAATALDRYHRSLDAHGYMATESYMDNMLSLKKLMNAIVPDKKIEDIASSENPYILQNVMQGIMSDAAKMFEINIMSPLEKAMAGVLDAFDGKKTDDKIRNFNLYMITKHGLERNRVLFVRDAVRKLRMDDSTKADAEKLQSEWGAKKEDLGNQLKSGIIDLKRYYEKMDEWIRDNVNKDYEAGEHDYSGMHGVQDIISMKDPYNDGEAIQSVMDSEAKMESVKAGSVRDYWGKVRAATRYSVDSDYNNGIIDRDLHGHVSKMFDWYVPLRNYDETTAEDVYGYITEIGDPKNRIGSTLAKARGHKYLSETNILAQIGALGNRAIKNGGDNAIKQAFARFARNHSDNNLIKETSVWYVKDPTTGIVEERYPDIPEGATADEINQIVSDFDTDMTMLKAQGLATKKFDRGNIGYRFERAKDKSQHIVDVMIAGKKHSFVILGNPRAAQALNGMLEHKNESLAGRTTAAISRFMAQTCTSYNPEFVMRNMIRDFEFASTNLLAKEGMAYTKTFEKYYAQVGLIEGIRNTKLSDFKKMTGFGLFSKYRNGTLDTSDKIQRYFKEFMENGGETGWVQIKNMKDLTSEYKLHVKTEKNGKARVSKNVFDFIFKNLENANEVAENLARFATYCASRDAGRSTVRSAYDAKEVSVNFNRHGSGNAIYSFKNGEMSNTKTARKNVYGFWASWFRNSSMFFNAGVQSTNLLIKNFKNNKAGTIGYIMAGPMMSGMAMALVNNMLIASEDEKDRKGVKDPYGELPDYIRRNNLCIYVGGGEFITIPLAIEERAFYGLGDLAAGLTFSKNISGQKNPALDAVGCMSQLVPVADYLGNASFGKNPGEETIKAIAPSAVSPIFEWFFNSDWKGAPIHRENKFDENQPSWMLAYKGTPEWLININKKANAWSNDVAPGNENMKGNDFLDAATDPSLLQHLYSSYLGGAATFMERVGGLVKKGNDTETKDIPFVRSLFYTSSEQTSLQRTKSKWYNYLDETEKARSNVKRLKSKNVPVDELVRNYGDYFKFKQSKDAEKINVIEAADKQMREWKKLRNKSGDTESINFANQNIDNIMMRAVDELDKLN